MEFISWNRKVNSALVLSGVVVVLCLCVEKSAGSTAFPGILLDAVDSSDSCTGMLTRRLTGNLNAAKIILLFLWWTNFHSDKNTLAKVRFFSEICLGLQQ